jgi:hypothetical protein
LLARPAPGAGATPHHARSAVAQAHLSSPGVRSAAEGSQQAVAKPAAAEVAQRPPLPFHLVRSVTGQLPVYSKISNGRTMKTTVLRKYTGDVESLRQALPPRRKQGPPKAPSRLHRRQRMPGAAPSSVPPRPLSRLGRPYRACFPHHRRCGRCCWSGWARSSTSRCSTGAWRSRGTTSSSSRRGWKSLASERRLEDTVVAVAL